MSRKKRSKRRSGNSSGAPGEQNGALVTSRPDVLNPQPLGPKTPEQRRLVTQTLMQYQGPIPPPQFLVEYSDALTDGGERVFRLIELEAKHTQEQEKTALDAQIRLMTRGQLFAFVVAIVAMIGAAYTASISTILAGAFLSVGIGTLAVAFLNMFQNKAPNPPPDAPKATKK